MWQSTTSLFVCQCVGELSPHLVVLTTDRLLPEKVRPARADQRHEHVTGVERFGQLDAKPLLREPVADVHEDGRLAELGGQPIIQATRSAPQSKCPIQWCRREELNFRPHPYQGCALPLSYGGKLGSRWSIARRHRVPLVSQHACCDPTEATT